MRQGMTGESWLTTRLDKLARWSKGDALWPLPLGTACCALEFANALAGGGWEWAGHGFEVERLSPRDSDVLLVAGTINDKMAPRLEAIYHQMPQPKWVIAIGACACSGGPYRSYNVVQGIDELIPVDVYVPGCPPTPDGLLYGVAQLRELIARRADRPHRRSAEEEAGERAHRDTTTADVV